MFVCGPYLVRGARFIPSQPLGFVSIVSCELDLNYYFHRLSKRFPWYSFDMLNQAL